MTRSLLDATLRALRQTAGMLMRIQSQADALGSSTFDPRVMSDYMLRDIGLLDGQARPEGSVLSSHESEAFDRLDQFILTPRAS